MGLGVGARASCRHAPDWATPGIPQCQSRGRDGGWDWELQYLCRSDIQYHHSDPMAVGMLCKLVARHALSVIYDYFNLQVL